MTHLMRGLLAAGLFASGLGTATAGEACLMSQQPTIATTIQFAGERPASLIDRARKARLCVAASARTRASNVQDRLELVSGHIYGACAICTPSD